MKADVLIVGGGLAGCTLGFLLRQAGIDVLATELRDARDKDKLCAGAMHPMAITAFDEIYGPGTFEELSPFTLSKSVLRCLDVAVTGSVTYQTLPRKRLDDCCLQRFVDEGGRIVDRARLVSIDETRHVAAFIDLRAGGTFEVSYHTLVGADGASSAVRRLLSGRNQRICPSVQGTVPFSGPDIIFEYRLFEQGYCWYIPHRQDATVGCMLHGATGLECRERIAEFCASLDMEIPPLRGAPIPEGDDVLLRSGKDAWLVGDAAGLIDAYHGGGILYALKSARVLAAALTGGAPYEQAMEETVASISKNNTDVASRYLTSCMSILAESRR